MFGLPNIWAIISHHDTIVTNGYQTMFGLPNLWTNDSPPWQYWWPCLHWASPDHHDSLHYYVDLWIINQTSDQCWDQRPTSTPPMPKSKVTHDNFSFDSGPTVTTYELKSTKGTKNGRSKTVVKSVSQLDFSRGKQVEPTARKPNLIVIERVVDFNASSEPKRRKGKVSNSKISHK